MWNFKPIPTNSSRAFCLFSRLGDRPPDISEAAGAHLSRWRQTDILFHPLSLGGTIKITFVISQTLWLSLQDGCHGESLESED